MLKNFFRHLTKFLISFCLLSGFFFQPALIQAITISSPDQIEYLSTGLFTVINDIAVDSSGHIYVSDYAGRIHYYDGSWSLFEGGDDVPYPVGIAVNSSGDIFVASNCVISSFDANGNFNGNEGTEGCFSEVAVSNSDELFAILSGYVAHNVHYQGPGYDYWAWTDYHGSGDYLTTPADLYIDQDNNFYVADDGSDTVVKYTAGGGWAALPAISQVDEPSGISADSEGNVYLVDRDYGHLAMFDDQTQTWSYYSDEDVLGTPQSVAAYTADNKLYLFVTDQTNERIVKLTYNLPEPSPTPTLTPTLTPTAAPSSLSNSTSRTHRHSSATSPATPFCGAAKPAATPDLFQIDVTDNQATLYYTPVNNHNRDYFIAFSDQPNTFQHSTLTGQSNATGVLSFSINHLKPNTTYYFRVRAQNGCMPGDFSQELAARTRLAGQLGLSSFYKYGSTKNSSPNLANWGSSGISNPSQKSENQTKINDQPELDNQPAAAAETDSAPSPVVETSPSPAETDRESAADQKCFLWWCW